MRKAGFLFSAVATIVLFFGTVSAQTTAFSYQGSLKDGATGANGNYDFQFALFDAVSGGNQLGSTLSRNTVAVANGIFSVSLDFGSQFPGANRFLEIRVKLTGGGALTTLTPRQQVNSDPYSVKSLNTDTASSLNCAACVTAAQIASVNGASITGTVPVASVPAGSGNYIQNQNAAPQSSSNFNISGTGTANIFNASTQFNLNGNRVLSTNGTSNLFVGVGAGTNNTGILNAFVGAGAGSANTSGVTNSFFGTSAGGSNTLGAGNSFFGTSAGASNQAGNNNAFFGVAAGTASTASLNSFFGSGAGQSTTSGGSNSFFGTNAGFANTVGASNTAIGSGANLGSGNLQYAAAIGADSTVATSNTIALGRSNGSDQVAIAGNLLINGSVGIGSSVPGRRLEVVSSAIDAIYGFAASGYGVTGASNGSVGVYGNSNLGTGVKGVSNNDIGVNGISTNYVGVYGSSTNGIGVYGTSGGSNDAGYFLGPVDITGQLFVGTYGGEATEKLTVKTGTSQYGLLHTDGTVSVGSFVGGSTGGGWYGTKSNHSLSFFVGNGPARLTINTDGTVSIPTMATQGGAPLCRNGPAIAFCSSSLRYKKNIVPFDQGLSLLNKLRPITFDWINGQPRDLGLGAEDVEKVEPLLVTYNDKGQVEGVKYDRIGVVLVNAVKEQQEQIEKQQTVIEKQQAVIDQLEKRLERLEKK